MPHPFGGPCAGPLSRAHQVPPFLCLSVSGRVAPSAGKSETCAQFPSLRTDLAMGLRMLPEPPAAGQRAHGRPPPDATMPASPVPGPAHEPADPPPIRSRPHRPRHRGRWPAGRRAVDDQHGHGGRGGDGAAGPRARHRRLRAGARHGEHGRSGRRGARDRRPARAARRDRADRRRLPLQRAQAAARTPRLRRGAGQVPHQPGQRRPRQQARPAVRRDDRDRLPPRQAGAHRRQLGQPRPGPADAADGRELAPPASRSRRTT